MGETFAGVCLEYVVFLRFLLFASFYFKETLTVFQGNNENFKKFHTIEVLKISKNHFFQYKTLQKFHPLKIGKNGGVQYGNLEPKRSFVTNNIQEFVCFSVYSLFIFLM